MMKKLLITGCWLLAAQWLTAQPAGVQLDTLQVQHIDFQGRSQQGVIICNTAIAKDLQEIFSELYRQKYPIERIRPISDYDNDDERSMQANNTSCYCYRPIAGSTKLSNHARGMAIDINPLYNPCVRRKKDGTLKVDRRELLSFRSECLEIVCVAEQELAGADEEETEEYGEQHEHVGSECL